MTRADLIRRLDEIRVAIGGLIYELDELPHTDRVRRIRRYLEEASAYAQDAKYATMAPVTED
jgi:hypothetical protein